MGNTLHSNSTVSSDTSITSCEPLDHKTPPYLHSLSADDAQYLDTLHQQLTEARERQTGYPCNHLFDYSELYRFLEFSINNLGDPFHHSNFNVNTHDIEREMIDTFAQLTAAPTDNYWGYINNGGTEGNMYGIYLAREVTKHKGITYFSESAHYSVPKILRVLNMQHIMIKQSSNGEIDYDDLRETLKIHRDTPPIIIANTGTTMTGALDNITTIRTILDDLAITHSYIHCDAALSGMILPFVDNPPPFGFNAGIDSIAISGHKMIGSPIPCGVVLAKKEYVNLIARGVEYVGALDTTLSGSRNAFSPLLLWYAFRRYGHDGLKKLVQESFERADYAIKQFQQRDIKAWRNEHSITVVFPRPSEQTIAQWQIAVKDDIAHIITLPHLKCKTICQIADEVANDIERESK